MGFHPAAPGLAEAGARPCTGSHDHVPSRWLSRASSRGTRIPHRNPEPINIIILAGHSHPWTQKNPVRSRDLRETGITIGDRKIPGSIQGFIRRGLRPLYLRGQPPMDR